MKIAVCIKQVPDTSEIRIDPKTNTLIRDGVPSIINPDDKGALEAALSLKDKLGCEVVVVSMGPFQAEAALREALAMGADDAYLVSDRAFAGSDTLATSTIIAAALKKIGFDAIIGGRQAIDGDTAQVGPQIAEHLGIPQITYCASIDFDGKKFSVVRQFEDRIQRLEVEGPVLLTCLGTSFKPRYMNVRDIVAQDEKEIHMLTFADLGLEKANIGLAGSPTKVKQTMTKQYNGEKKLIEGEPSEVAKVIVKELKEKHII